MCLSNFIIILQQITINNYFYKMLLDQADMICFLKCPKEADPQELTATTTTTCNTYFTYHQTQAPIKTVCAPVCSDPTTCLPKQWNDAWKPEPYGDQITLDATWDKNNLADVSKAMNVDTWQSIEPLHKAWRHKRGVVATGIHSNNTCCEFITCISMNKDGHKLLKSLGSTYRISSKLAVAMLHIAIDKEYPEVRFNSSGISLGDAKNSLLGVLLHLKRAHVSKKNTWSFMDTKTWDNSPWHNDRLEKILTS